MFNDVELFVSFYTPVTKDHNTTEHRANHSTGTQHILTDCRIGNIGICHVCSFVLREFFYWSYNDNQLILKQKRKNIRKQQQNFSTMQETSREWWKDSLSLKIISFESWKQLSIFSTNVISSVFFLLPQTYTSKSPEDE